MKGKLFPLLLALLVVLPLLGAVAFREGLFGGEKEIDESGLSGTWKGTYDSFGGASQGPVRWTAEITCRRGRLTGRITEPNTFGDPSASRLYAEIEGTVTGDGTVSFVKTYDGTGGVSHSIDYRGKLDRTTMTITGKWSGMADFRMTLVAPRR